MLKERRLAAETVAEALFAAEKAIDAALASTATLAALTARQLGGLPNRVLIPFASRNEPASTDVAVCLP